jgi:quinoprotein dehydrogenase-associated probable ABC transporter substrate-binding protein
MSSGSKQTVLGALILAATYVFVGWLAITRHAPVRTAGPVHLVVPPVSETGGVVPPPDPHVLRVCSDPNNLPFSDRTESGFENRLAELTARELHRSLAYYWQPQRRGFIRTTLNANRCDVVIGVPTASEVVRVTRPYYRSSFMFVSRRGRRPLISSFDDPRLRHLRVGIPITGTDYANPPAAQALAVRHIIDNVRGYPVYGDYSRPRPSWGVLDALLRNEVDVAVAWGPLAGYFARHSPTPIDIVAVDGPADPALPVAFDVSMGVRRNDRVLAAALDEVLARRGTEIRQVLASYGVPLAKAPKEVQP